ncbi:MAG TPA: MarR family transcriptional regulator [Dehalococcoidia bacterium]|nr:MarR family transcriptional regulator [Dehalococcoidia bacterium]
MKTEILDIIAEDLFTIPPLIGRSIRRKLLRTALAHIREDISPPHFEIMRTLDETGTLHVTEIGERLQIPKPQMTHLIDKLVSLEMVERQTDVRDRRIINIALTSKSKTLLKKHKRIMESAIKETLSSLTDKELEELSTSLRKLRDILQKLQ